MQGFEPRVPPELIETLQARRRAAAARMRTLLTQLEAAEQEFDHATQELARVTRAAQPLGPNGDHAA